MPQPDPTAAEVLLARMSVSLDRLTQKLENIDNWLRGADGKNGLIGKMGHVERTAAENRDDIADLRRQLRERADIEGPQTIKAKAEAWVMRAGVLLAFLGAILEAVRHFSQGGTP